MLVRFLDYLFTEIIYWPNTTSRIKNHTKYIQLGAMKLVLWRHWMHATQVHLVTAENQFHCIKLYLKTKPAYPSSRWASKSTVWWSFQNRPGWRALSWAPQARCQASYHHGKRHLHGSAWQHALPGETGTLPCSPAYACRISPTAADWNAVALAAPEPSQSFSSPERTQHPNRWWHFCISGWQLKCMHTPTEVPFHRPTKEEKRENVGKMKHSKTYSV